MRAKSDVLKRIDVFVGQRLRERRVELGLTLMYVADKIGISHQQVQKYELGQSRVSVPIMYQLASLYGVRTHHFFQGLSIKEKEETQDDPFPQHDRLNMMVITGDPVWEIKLRHAVDLSNTQADTCFVRDTIQAMNMLRLKKNEVSEFPRPDIMLLELDSFKKDGLLLLRNIKSDRNLMDIPTIVVSSFLCNTVIKLVYSYHASGYMSKNHDNFDKNVCSLIHYWSSAMLLPHVCSYEAIMTEDQIFDNLIVQQCQGHHKRRQQASADITKKAG